MSGRGIKFGLVMAGLLGLGGAGVPTAWGHEIIIEPPIRRIWIEPVYRIVIEKVWIEGHYDSVADRVWVPARWEKRPVEVWEDGRCVIRYEYVEIPGHWETTWRQVWVPGHYEYRERRILVTPGHWEPGPIPPLPIPLPRPIYRPNPPSVPVEGYASPKETGPSPFSPLYEWPK